MVLVGSEVVVESGVSPTPFYRLPAPVPNHLRSSKRCLFLCHPLLISLHRHRKLTYQGLVSLVGTYQVALVAKALSKPFYVLAESYKFLRHYPLSQTDLPLPRLHHPGSTMGPTKNTSSIPTRKQTPSVPLSFQSSLPPHQTTLSRTLSQAPATPVKGNSVPQSPQGGGSAQLFGSSTAGGTGEWARFPKMEMSREMEELNPMVDVTTPDLIDFIITDLGAPLSPTSVSQYLVAQFSS
jgi:translation initiation factor eIF-2B subunit alpha